MNGKKFEVGQRVMVTDQLPAVEGVVEEVSTWQQILGEPADNNCCYRIRCDEWQGTDRWIGGIFVEAT